MLGADGALAPMDAAAKAEISAKVDELSSMALRVLAISCRPLDALPYGEEDDVEEESIAESVGSTASFDASEPSHAAASDSDSDEAYAFD